MALFRDHPGEPVPEEIFWTFIVQGKITEADTPTIWVGATSSRLNSGPPPSSPHFYAGCPTATLLLHLGLGRAPNMLACIPGGMVNLQLNNALGKDEFGMLRATVPLVLVMFARVSLMSKMQVST